MTCWYTLAAAAGVAALLWLLRRPRPAKPPVRRYVEAQPTRAFVYQDLAAIEFTPLPVATELPENFGWAQWERAVAELEKSYVMAQAAPRRAPAPREPDAVIEFTMSWDDTVELYAEV